jgi:hypothetical protein
MASRSGTFQGEHLETDLKGQPDGRFPSGGSGPSQWNETSEMVRLQAIPTRPAVPTAPPPGQVSMKGNGSARRLWNCPLDRHHGDMETYGRSYSSAA